MNFNSIENGLKKRYGLANFDITHGSMSSKKTINISNEKETAHYIHPQNVITKFKGEEFDLHFMVGAVGNLLKYADEVRVSFHSLNSSNVRELMLAMPVPKDVIIMNKYGFDASATVTGISFTESVKVFMNVDAIFNDSQLVDILNEGVENEEDLIKKNVVVSINAAKLFVNAEDTKDGE
ncbi:hypothetical protein [Exiguobacterium artemiae]|uniref:hypothetical protein n=1 Tax=Exiguobacterium artemiae TaxID=340145 RepID=UPI003D035401